MGESAKGERRNVRLAGCWLHGRAPWPLIAQASQMTSCSCLAAFGFRILLKTSERGGGEPTAVALLAPCTLGAGPAPAYRVLAHMALSSPLPFFDVVAVAIVVGSSSGRL
jgi:hypothetical protein